MTAYLLLPPLLYSAMMKLFFLPLVLLLLSVHVSSVPCNFPAIFNFGDSNSDTGGLSATFGPALSPNGETFFRQPAGRFSDGRLIIDFLAESLRLPFLSAYLDSIGTNFTHGVNFATVASAIIDQNETLSRGGYSPFSLDLQLKQFSQFKSRSQLVYKRGGIFMDLMPKEKYFMQALYTIDIGQNDLVQGSSLYKSAEEFIPDAISRFKTVIKGIYDEGGRYFWIHNTGPLGCLSYTLVNTKRAPREEFDSLGCAIPYNELAQKFNRILNQTVVELRTDLPHATFTYVDVYSVKYSIFSQAKKHGFEHPFKACCGFGGGAYNYDPNVRCGHLIEVNGTIVVAKSCKNPSKRIIWDGIHYSDRTTRLIFSQIATGKFSDPANSPSLACQGKKSDF